MQVYPAPSGACQRPRPRRSRLLFSMSLRRRPRLWAGLSVLIATTLATSAGPADRSIDKNLLETLHQIEVAFRTAEARRLGPILPRNSKVLVGLDSFHQPEAYYAADQVILLFQEIFEAIRVIRFDLVRDKLGAAGPEVLYVPARWALREEASGIRETRLLFTIRHEGDRYYIRSIKEFH